MNAVRLGLARGGIELRQSLTYWPDLFGYLFFPVLQVVVLFLMRGHHVPGTTFSLGSLTLPSGLGMGFVFGGTLGVTGLLTVDREDGTLLRAKATPNGMTAYVIGKITQTSVTNLAGLVLTLVLGLIAFPGVTLTVGGAAASPSTAHRASVRKTSGSRHDPSISTEARFGGSSAARMPSPSQYIGNTWPIACSQPARWVMG